MALSDTNEFLTDLFDRRGQKGNGHNCARLLELHGATIIEPTIFEPDPTTHRGEYYYNAVTNTLYKKIVTRRESDTGIITAHWHKVGG